LDECFPPSYVEHQYGQPSSLEGFKPVIVSLRRDVALAAVDGADQEL